MKTIKIVGIDTTKRQLVMLILGILSGAFWVIAPVIPFGQEIQAYIFMFGIFVVPVFSLFIPLKLPSSERSFSLAFYGISCFLGILSGGVILSCLLFVF